MKNLHTRKTSKGSNFGWVIRQMSINQKSGRQTFRRRFVSGSRLGAIHSIKISGNLGPKLNGSVRSNRKSFEKIGPPFEVVLFSRSDRSEFWLNGSRPRFALPAGMLLQSETKIEPDLRL